MPLYEYSCPNCGEFEVTQRITDPPLERCPLIRANAVCDYRCDAPLKRLISLTGGFILEPKGVYQPVSGRDSKGKQREEKISPRAYERQDRELRSRMLATRDRAKRQGFTPQIDG